MEYRDKIELSNSKPRVLTSNENDIGLLSTNRTSYESFSPSYPSEGSIASHSRESMNDQHGLKQMVLPSYLSRRRADITSPTSTYALAQASLGIGLPHGLFHESSSPSTEIHNTPSTSSTSTYGLRKTKSFHKSRSMSSSTSSPQKPTNNVPRRSRALSINTSTLLTTSPPTEKDRESKLPSAKRLPRRASFWSKKKAVSSEIPVVLPKGNDDRLYLPLSLIQPGSPFVIPSLLHDSSEENTSLQQHSRGLSRSFSERRQSQPDDIVSSSAHSRGPTRRPITADSARDSHFTPTFILDSAFPLSDSPIHSPVVEANDPSLSRNAESRPPSTSNTPLLQRLSLNLFPSLYNVPSSPSSTVSSPVSGRVPRINRSHDLSRDGISKPDLSTDTPETYLSRLLVTANKADITSLLACSADTFHTQALQLYISQFDFSNDPLDIALRRLLMNVSLPRETQQIDRVMEAFAQRYLQCNEALFLSDDQPYVLSFSLIMLHTDVFNRSNKKKMSKADYIKNTSIPNVHAEVLEYFYDNIVFAPFIFVEDPLDISLENNGGNVSSTSINMMSNSNSGSLLKGPKLDPYYLISNHLLEPLRIPISMYISPDSPFTYGEELPTWHFDQLQDAFASAAYIEVDTVSNSTTSISKLTPRGLSITRALSVPPTPTNKPFSLRVSKVGILNRKEQLTDGGKKTINRKWRQFSVLLTGSQLLFFRDLAWAALFSTENGSDLRPGSFFRPDEVISLKDTVALLDTSYDKHAHTFCFVLPSGRQLLLQALDHLELNSWVSRINYASAFKSSGVKMRPLAMSGQDVKLTGIAAATSHLHDLHLANDHPKQWDGDMSLELLNMLSPSVSPLKSAERRVTMLLPDRLDLELLAAEEVYGTDQFKLTFETVKADLAASKIESSKIYPSPLQAKSSILSEPSSSGPISSASSASFLPSYTTRLGTIRSFVEQLEVDSGLVQTQLERELLRARNIGILTPFQRSTRMKLLSVAESIGRNVMQLRIQIARLACFRDVLVADLEAEMRDQEHTRRAALRAATETLLSQQVLDHSTSNLPPTITARSHCRDSTVQSFYSALDFAVDWSYSDIAYSEPSPQSDSPRHSSESLSSPLSPNATPQPLTHKRASLSASDDIWTHQKFYTAQESIEAEAEEWNATRCAKRVSLVRIPSSYIAQGLSSKRDRITTDTAH